MSPTSTRTTITIDRTFSAPRALVWQAFTDPEHIRQWWGPEHFDCPEAIADLRTGGSYRFAMRGPDGNTNWSGGVYRKVVPMDRFVATDRFVDADGHPIDPASIGVPGDWPDELILTVTFTDAPGGATQVSIRVEGMPVEMVEPATAGWNSSLDKLAATLR